MSSSKRKKERRHQRYLRNVQKEIDYKREAWANGKLIEENHNNGPYSANYTKELAKRLRVILYNIANEEGNDDERILYRFRQYKMKLRDLILHWSPEAERDYTYQFLKHSLEVYWDESDNLANFLKFNNPKLPEESENVREEF